MYNFHFAIDKINKNKKLEKFFLKKYKNYPPKLSDVIVGFGGDGFRLQPLKKYRICLYFRRCLCRHYLVVEYPVLPTPK